MARVPVPLSANYASTRTGVDKQRRVNLYPHADGGFRQFPGEVSFRSSSDANNAVFLVSRYLQKSSDLTGNADAKVGTVSFWFYCSNTDTTILYRGNGANTNIITLTPSNSRIDFIFQNSSGTSVLGLSGDITFTASTWFHVMASWDLAAGTTNIYVNGVEAKHGTPTATNDNIDYTQTSHQLPYSLHTNNVAFAEVYMNFAEYVDLSVGSNRSKFYDSGYPVDLGTDGSRPTGTAPIIYLANPYGSFETNLGTGGDFTVTGGSISSLAGGPGAITYGDDRGSIVMGSTMYAVLGSYFCSISSAGAVTVIGSIGGTQRCVLDTDGTQIVITAGANKYLYTSSTLSSITDADLGDANTNAYLDSRFWFDNAGKVFGSDIDDASSINALYFVTAESFTDDVTRVLSANELLYFFGTDSIEVWYSSGVGIPPIDRQAVIDAVGIVGRYAVTVIENVIYFVDQHRHFNRLVGSQLSPIEIYGLDKEIGEYTTVDDCILNSYAINREHFVEMNFPTEDTCWTYHIESGQISKREDTNGSAFNVTSYVTAYSKLLGLNRLQSKIFEFSTSTYQDDGDSITRTLDTGIIDSSVLGVPGRKMICYSLVLTLYASASAAISVSLSADDAAFGTARSITLTTGTQQIKITRWGRFTQGIFRITTTANAQVDILKAEADLEALSV